ncbi:UNVERIFIED_CONTAM: hypothetical protein Sradi_5107100 [Sesamum radiatum]|uniref:Retrotransposon gag domain-containing protein n=1 Tax=Sesamum radiatum TaxID=300843 RepID=A0AAW2M2P3_SESRA
MELHQQMIKETMPTERGIPFSEDIMEEKLLVHFQTPSYLPTYDGTTNLFEHIQLSFLFQHQFTWSKKYKKLAISLFGVKQEEETLKAYVQHFNTAILEVSTYQQEVLVSVFTKGLCGGPLLKSRAKKPNTNFLDVLTRAEMYINLEDTWLVKKNSHDKRKASELPFSYRGRGESRGRFNPLNPKQEHYTLLITNLARMLMAIDQHLALQWP